MLRVQTQICSFTWIFLYIILAVFCICSLNVCVYHMAVCIVHVYVVSSVWLTEGREKASFSFALLVSTTFQLPLICKFPFAMPVCLLSYYVLPCDLLDCIHTHVCSPFHQKSLTCHYTLRVGFTNNPVKVYVLLCPKLVTLKNCKFEYTYWTRAKKSYVWIHLLD